MAEAAKRIVFMVPAYNEAANLPFVIADLREFFPAASIVVVDDGSSDNTAAIATSLGATLLRLPFNLGIGGAVQTALRFAEAAGYDIAVQFDGDGQHRADQVSRLLDALDRFDVAIGSRYLEDSGYRAPIARRLGMSVLNGVNSTILRTRFTDSTSGFRAYRREAVQFLARDYPHDYAEPETIVTLILAGFRVTEVAVSMRERIGGRSSITLLHSLYYMLKVTLALIVGVTRRRNRNRPGTSERASTTMTLPADA